MQYNDLYSSTQIKETMNSLGVKNVFALPRVKKIVVNVGAGEAVVSKQLPAEIAKQLGIITGQKAVITKAKKSVSAFKVREGLPIGVMVTLRGKRMIHFLDKMVNVVVPMLRDFRGLSANCVDQSGNLNVGFPEQTIFPEIDFDNIDKMRGLQVTVVTTAKNHDMGKKYFELLGVPFQK